LKTLPFLLLTLGFALARPALAADLSVLDYGASAESRYERCLELVKDAPATALDQAGGWVKAGGGPAAQHCEGLALVKLKRYAEAAGVFEKAAKAGKLKAPSQRAALDDQAGNAWLLAGKADKADAAFSAALTEAPADEDVLADRARARGLRKDWAGAEADLSAVIAIDPNRADALVLRASARHALGQKAAAEADIASALDVDPDYPEALLERGNMKLEDGDSAGAKADWQLVVAGAPGTDAAATATVRLQALSAKPSAH
jgi:tetratricopeptide (TPR) repeat protein